MNCPSCESRASNPNSGLYHADCPHCKAQMWRNAPSYFDHMKNVKGIPGSTDRREYFNAVERKDGKEYADILRNDYSDWWEGRRAKQSTKTA